MLTLTRQARVRRTTPRARHQQRHRPAGQARKGPRLPPRAHGEHGVHATIRLGVLLGGACGRCILDSDSDLGLYIRMWTDSSRCTCGVSRITTLPTPGSATGRAASRSRASPAQAAGMPASNSFRERSSLASYNARPEPRWLTEPVATPIARAGFEGPPQPPPHTHAGSLNACKSSSLV